jgi:hypothetical protein
MLIRKGQVGASLLAASLTVAVARTHLAFGDHRIRVDNGDRDEAER